MHIRKVLCESHDDREPRRTREQNRSGVSAAFIMNSGTLHACLQPHRSELAVVLEETGMRQTRYGEVAVIVGEGATGRGYC